MFSERECSTAAMRRKGKAAGKRRSERSLASEQRSQAAGPYFTSDGKSVGEGVPVKPVAVAVFASHLELRACGCRAWFCEHCCQGKGIALKKRLVSVLETFQAMMMLTLTVDPKLFTSPREAYEYIRERRAIAELVRALKSIGVLITGRYFYVVEWQRHTQMAHFHVLVEADRIEHADLARLWGVNRPAWAPRWEGSYDQALKGLAPEFGHVRFSVARFASPQHAANYACKYLIKHPEHGYPEWVKQMHHVKRFSTSRGFWPSAELSDEEIRRRKQDARDRAKRRKLERVKRTTIGERLARCGQKACIVEVREVITAAGEIVTERPRFWAALEVGFRDALELLGIEFGCQRKVQLRNGEATRLRRAGATAAGVATGGEAGNG